MPSIEVTGKSGNISERKDGLYTPKITEQFGKTKQSVKMPCSPYSDPTLQQSPPNVTMTVPNTKRPKPRSFSLLVVTFNTDKDGKSCSHLDRQRSVTNSYEKETHVLTHTVSAPGALSVSKEPPLEDRVFEEEEENEGKKIEDEQERQDDQEKKQVGTENKAQEQSEAGHCFSAKDENACKRAESEPEQIGVKQEDVDVKEDETREDGQENVCKVHSEKSDAEASGEKLDGDNNEAEKVISADTDGKENDGQVTKKKMGDIDTLTQDLQSTLKLEDNETDDTFKSTEREVSSLADDIDSLSLKDKTDKKPKCTILIDSTERSSTTSSTATGPTRLRAKGLQDDVMIMGRSGVILSTQTGYSNQGLQSQAMSNFGYNFSSSSWHTDTQPQLQPLPLPSFQIFQKTQTNTQGQVKQSVVSPPGQGNLQRMFMHPSGTHMQMIKANYPQSKQIQYAQDKLFPQTQPQNYPQNNLSDGGSLFPMNQQRSPQESTGQPSEVSWPLTPESMISVDDIIDTITSDEECRKSPVENEEPIPVGGMDFVPSPQSPWQGSHTTSTASFSPQHSPLYGDCQQPSPVQQVPDAYPWTPDSSAASPGEPFSPDSPTFNIQVTGGMTAGIVTVQDTPSMSSHSPCKRQRNNSSASSEMQEIQDKRIKEIETELMTVESGLGHAHPNLNRSDWMYQTQIQHDPPFRQPRPPAYTAVPARFTPTITPTFTPIPTPHTPSQTYMHPPSKTPCTGELEEFRSRLEGYSVEELLALDDDNDTVLHVAICQEKVALSVAISERLWKEKKSLDILNKLHQTPLYLSVICNLHILTEILINYGASLNIGSNPPLHAAAMKGNNEAIEAIIKGISNRGYTEEDVSELLNITNYHGKTALMQAIEAHSDDIDCRKTVKLLLMNNDSSMFPDSKSGKTALHYAVELRKIDLIHILLENCDDAGKLVNSRMYNGNTALHLIVGRTLPEDEILYIVGTLMNRGANVSIDNMDKEKPHDLVRREHTKVKQRLHGQANRIR